MIMSSPFLRALPLIAAVAVTVASVRPSCAVEVDETDGKHRYPVRRSDQEAASSVQATFTVRPGQSIQAAADRARPGDRIEVLPGVYHESVAIDLDNIELVGVRVDGDRPILDGKNKMHDAVLVSGHNFTISGFGIRNYTSNGVVVSKAKNATFRDLVTSNTGKYAVYPVECDGVLVERCVSSGVWDAAIYAGQCRNVILRDNEAYNSTIGLETENCVNVLIENNSAYNNSLGILVVLLPNLPTTEMSNARVINNRCRNNNYPNTAPPGHIVSMVEPGVGIAINAADRAEVTGNLIEGNQSYGIAMYGLTDIFPDAESLNVEPNPDNNHVHGNTLSGNGSDPEKVANRFKKIGAPGGDLFWSGTGKGNVWADATDRTWPENLTGSAASASGGQ